MATEYNSSLPVMTEADPDQRLQTKIVDSVNPSQQAEVDADRNVHVEIHGDDPSGTDRVIRVSEQGALTPDGVYDAANNTKPGSAGVVAQTRNATAADSRQVERVTAKRGTVATDTVAMDTAIHDENGNPYSASNPLPVVLSNDEGGTPVHQYLESSVPVAPGASETLTYTVAGSALTLKKVCVSASGRVKAEIKVGAAVATPTRYVVFNSAAEPNFDKECPQNSIVAVGDVVSVTFTNNDKAQFTVYATIEGTLA